jgi:predicted esterase
MCSASSPAWKSASFPHTAFRVVLAALAALAISSAAAADQTPQPLPVGQIIDRVICMGDPAETYSLYLPSGYVPTRRWPVIYAFDPLARGRTPVKLYKDVAEKYGYILAASNTSRNFLADLSKPVNAIWQDTHRRLALDPRRTYTAGFSGGARVAGKVALECPECRIAAVIAQGAGYPAEVRISRKDAVPYFLTVGDQDFNWPEIIRIRREREDLGLSYRVRVFAGAHQWAPPSVFKDAVEWVELKAMQAGAEPENSGFIERLLEQTERQASEAENKSDPIALLNAYRSLVADFAGFTDVGEFERKLQALKKSAGLRAALKKEDGAISGQQQVYQRVGLKIDALADATMDQQLNLRIAVLDELRSLKAGAEHSQDEGKRLISVRAFNGLWAHGIEAGQAALEGKRLAQAETYFLLMSEVMPDEPWPFLLLAETRAAGGDRKQALKYIREAMQRGLANPDVLENDANLQVLRQDPEFQRLVESLKEADKR